MRLTTKGGNVIGKTRSFILCYLIFFSSSIFAEDIAGFWKTIDDETHMPRSIVAIYEYQKKYYGRLIATYDDNGKIYDSIEKPIKRAPAVKGNPYYVGLDFMWELEKHGKKFTNGVILDPEKGFEYSASAWIDDKGDLTLRGEMFFLGKNQTWPKAVDSDFPQGFTKPDLKTLVPKIPEVIEN